MPTSQPTGVSSSFSGSSGFTSPSRISSVTDPTLLYTIFPSASTMTVIGSCVEPPSDLITAPVLSSANGISRFSFAKNLSTSSVTRFE